MDNRLLSIFYNKFLSREKKDYHGLEYYTYLNEDGIAVLAFENPKKLSVNLEVLKSVKDDLIHDFLKFIPKIGNDNYNRDLFKTLFNKIYVSYEGEIIEKDSDSQFKYRQYRDILINQEDLDHLKRLAKLNTEFNILGLESVCSVMFDNAVMEDSDHLRVDLNVKLLNPKYKGVEIDYKKLKEVVNQLVDDDNFYDYINHGFVDNILNFFWGNPLLLDRNYMFTTSNITFFDENGNQIRWWETD